jgi:hypothetical protein
VQGAEDLYQRAGASGVLWDGGIIVEHLGEFDGDGRDARALQCGG